MQVEERQTLLGGGRRHARLVVHRMFRKDQES
jgi:hypothetical protein